MLLVCPDPSRLIFGRLHQTTPKCTNEHKKRVFIAFSSSCRSQNFYVFSEVLEHTAPNKKNRNIKNLHSLKLKRNFSKISKKKNLKPWKKFFTLDKREKEAEIKVKWSKKCWKTHWWGVESSNWKIKEFEMDVRKKLKIRSSLGGVGGLWRA